MKASQELKNLIEELVGDHRQLMTTRQGDQYMGYVDQALWSAFLAKSQLMIQMLGPFGKPWAEAFGMGLNTNQEHAFNAGGVLSAIHDSVTKGRLRTVEELVASEILGDLLGHAEALIEKKYMLPAAVVLRAVWEERLRTFVAVNGLSITGKPGIENFKVALVQAGVLDKLVAKQIDYMAGVGNAAAHNLAEFKPENVPTQYQMTLDFLARFTP